ncbi:unnamed protein product [Vitrella brassicaformis CCMP3155]|uniref:Uncharacterized protein n=1 Tax=Vitrella brassicaformis (strain CCMP3155) TaxID=1169540 RepID=A0A0G4EFD6_VITBC|nr:unnamed protein product [Vitrella brassicaformis CCMP3155]|eukprot:CEL94691.1 unnamed protein product [Vitrella brassicaformis CCMP3155]
MDRNQANSCSTSGSEQDSESSEKAVPSLRRSPLGVSYQVLREGNGPQPQHHHRVKYDFKSLDAFGGKLKQPELKGVVAAISEVHSKWRREALLSMRVGEIRRLIVPPELNELSQDTRYIEYKLLAII